MTSRKIPDMQGNLKHAVDTYGASTRSLGDLFGDEDVEEMRSFFFTDGRLKSFELRVGGWTYDKPEKAATCKSEQLAANGFFFPAISRKEVTCAFCFMDITCSAHLDPRIEHARRNPRCFFVTLGKPEDEWTIEDGMFLLQFRRRALSVRNTAMRRRDFEEKRDERRRNRMGTGGGDDGRIAGH